MQVRPSVPISLSLLRKITDTNILAWSISLSPSGEHYASTGSSGTVKINRAGTDSSNFGETIETLSPRADGRNKFGMFVSYVRLLSYIL